MIEMPRSRSMSIQSDTTWRCEARPSHRPGQLDRPGVQQHLFGQRGLAGVRVGDDRERPPPLHFAPQRLGDDRNRGRHPNIVGRRRARGPPPRDVDLEWPSMRQPALPIALAALLVTLAGAPLRAQTAPVAPVTATTKAKGASRSQACGAQGRRRRRREVAGDVRPRSADDRHGLQLLGARLPGIRDLEVPDRHPREGRASPSSAATPASRRCGWRAGARARR